MAKRPTNDYDVSDVIHTVGPQGKQPDKLTQCYENSLSLTKENNLRTIAFPCISTGIYGYPQRAAAEVVVPTVKKFLTENKNVVRHSVFMELSPIENPLRSTSRILFPRWTELSSVCS